MATSRQGGAIVLEQESPWTQFLGGFGQGVSHGIQRSEQLMDKKYMMFGEQSYCLKKYKI